jgi:hypothetical protein
MQSIKKIQELSIFYETYNFFPEKFKLKEKLFLFPICEMKPEILKSFPEKAIMPFGIYMKNSTCGGNLHFNLIYKRNNVFYRIEPNDNMKIFYKKQNIAKLFAGYNYKVVYSTINNYDCVENSFKLLQFFIVKNFCN